MVKQISDNEIYFLIKYIKSVLWRVAKRLSYIQDTRHVKVEMGQIGCPETSVTHYHYTLPHVPEERRSQTEIFGHRLITAAYRVRRCHSVVLRSIEVPCHTFLCRVTQLRQCCMHRNSRSVWSCQPLPVSSPQFERKPFIVGKRTIIGMEQLSESSVGLQMEQPGLGFQQSA
jgi:hypothetical protein